MKLFSHITCIISVIVILSGCGKVQNEQSIRTIKDLDYKKVIVLSGSTQETFALQHLPKSKLVRVDNNADLYIALKTNKGDAALDAYVLVDAYMRENSGVEFAIDSIFASGVAFAFAPGNEELMKQFNIFLKEIQQSGLYQEIKERWNSAGSMETDMPVIPNKEENGVICFGTTGVSYPYSFVKGGKLVGLDVEMAVRFAAKLGKKLDIKTFTFSSLITAISAGKVEMAGNSIAITEERAKKMAFSDPYLWSKQSVVVRASEKKRGTGFYASLKNNFRRTFVQDKRYLLLLDGIWTTIRISLLAILLGTLLGALICWMRMSSVLWLVKFTKAYIYIFRGIPQVVLLMLLFYIVFSTSRLSGQTVSVIGFAIMFSAYVSEMFRTSIESVSKGQIEASLAMGFTKVQTFRNITMPITVQRVFPVFTGEVISLIKCTSIVGYIAVEDLTKVSDMIRSLTFDAFFSLIVVTVIYFVLIVLVISALKRIQKRTAPRRDRFYRIIN